MEKKLSTSFRKRQIARFVHHTQIKPGQTFSQFAATAAQFFLLQLINQVKQIEESAPFAVFDGLPGNGDGHVGFASSGAANQNDVALVRKKASLIERFDRWFIDGGFAKVEVVEVLLHREPGYAHAVADTADASLGQFCGE